MLNIVVLFQKKKSIEVENVCIVLKIFFCSYAIFTIEELLENTSEETF